MNLTKYTIQTKTLGVIPCQSYTLLTNKGIMYSMDESITQESKDVGYVGESELLAVILMVDYQEQQNPTTSTIQFEPTIGQA